MSYPAYPAYRDSGIAWLGSIPEHWEVRRLRYLAQIVNEKFDHKPLNVPYVGLENIESWTGKLLDSDAPLDITSTVTVFHANDILFGKLRPYLAKAIVTSFYGVGTTELMVLRSYEGVLNRFLLFLLLSESVIKQIDASTYGTKMPRMSPDFLANFTFPLPPLDEQRAIVAFLDAETSRIDTLVAKQQRMIVLLEEKRKAVISHAVTRGLDANVALRDSGIAWLGLIPEHWATDRIKQVVSIYGGGTPSKEKLEFWDGDIPWVSPKDMKILKINDSEDHITQIAIQQSATNLIDSGAILIVFRSGILKHTIPVAINTVPVTINQDMKAIVPDKSRILNSYFVYIILGNQEVLLAEWSKIGATVDSLETSLFRNTLLPLPPLDEQRAIVAYLDEQTAIIDTLIGKARRAIDLLGEHRAALISAAVTGQIDVRAVASEEPA